MRLTCLLLTACALGPIGCSALFVHSGEHLETLTTQAEVRQTLGTPARMEQNGDAVHEEFRTRRKIAEPWKGIYLCMGNIATLGLGELFFLPHELFVAGRRSVVGQTIRVSYDASGNVTRIDFNGHVITGHPPPPVPSDAPPASPVPTTEMK